jgi:hypothetical protein
MPSSEYPTNLGNPFTLGVDSGDRRPTVSFCGRVWRRTL